MNDWNNANYQQNAWNSFYQQPFSTNLVYVTSPDEALIRANQRNSEMVFFHQDRPVFYRVKVDNDGRKAWQEIEYSIPDKDKVLSITKDDIKRILDRLDNLEKCLLNAKEEKTNVESNG